MYAAQRSLTSGKVYHLHNKLCRSMRLSSISDTRSGWHPSSCESTKSQLGCGASPEDVHLRTSICGFLVPQSHRKRKRCRKRTDSPDDPSFDASPLAAIAKQHSRPGRHQQMHGVWGAPQSGANVTVQRLLSYVRVIIVPAKFEQEEGAQVCDELTQSHTS